jgi:hypothetical protein
MTAHITKTWIEDGKLITEVFEGKDIYKREWVGLTEEDKQIAFDDTQEASGGFREFADAIEAKLKEKNNG